MNILDINFVKHLGIQLEEESLVLYSNERLQNHIKTIHAGALYTLAESQSGYFLQNEFKDIDISVIPLLRSSSVKYKASASGKIVAFASANRDLLEKFRENIIKKGRGVIGVNVELKDSKGNIVIIGEFTWFIQKSV